MSEWVLEGDCSSAFDMYVMEDEGQDELDKYWTIWFFFRGKPIGKRRQNTRWRCYSKQISLEMLGIFLWLESGMLIVKVMQYCDIMMPKHWFTFMKKKVFGKLTFKEDIDPKDLHNGFFLSMKYLWWCNVVMGLVEKNETFFVGL